MELRPLTCVVWTRRDPSELRFLSELAAAFGARCEFREEGDCSGASAIIVIDADIALAERLKSLPITTLAILATSPQEPPAVTATVRFAGDTNLTWPFTGTALETTLAWKTLPFPETIAGSVIAAMDGCPIWMACDSGPARHYTTTVPVPSMRADEMICDRCKGGNFFATLPLIYTFREMHRASGWQPPPLRASFMFDDPNLHSTRYGFIDYSAVVASATGHNYHVAFATVPLDAWFAHDGASALFRDHGTRISLLIHGNDHTLCELAQPYSPSERRRLIYTALHRIETLEKRSRIEISRVMAAPHGACSEEMLADMADFGFEAACISPWSLRDHNPGKPWLQRLGIATSEWIVGLPVIPRFRLAAGCEDQIRLAALLDQPIVPVGHHQDLRDGLGILETLARFINSLGSVQWSNLQAIARSNFRTRRQDTTFCIQPYSNRLSTTVPDGCRQLSMESPVNGDRDFQLEWLVNTPAGSLSTITSNGSHVAVDSGQVLAISRPSQNRFCPAPLARAKFWPVARRIAAEGRDRIAPIIERCRLRFPTGA